MRALTVLLGLAVSTALFAAEVPRQSPEFVIHFPDGKQDLLSNHKGKVVLLQFIFTTCPHCQQTVQEVSRMYKELGPKGFQPLAVTLNTVDPKLVNAFIREFNVNFPLGFSEQAPALSFLKIGVFERWSVPQIALIDRKGMIRRQTGPQGDPQLLNPASLRSQIEALLQESGGASAKRPAAKKRPS